MTEAANKCVFIGDGGVGKTCMLLTYANKRFPEDYVPDVFDNYNAGVAFENKHHTVQLWDTNGAEDYDHLRRLSYPETFTFLILFSLVDPISLENVKKKWYPEIQEHGPDRDVPTLLIGTKLDLREDTQIIESLQDRGQKPVTHAEGEKVAKELNCVGYFECSALTGKGLNEVFVAALQCLYFFEPEKIYQYSEGINTKGINKGSKGGGGGGCKIL